MRTFHLPDICPGCNQKGFIGQIIPRILDNPQAIFTICCDHCGMFYIAAGVYILQHEMNTKPKKYKNFKFIDERKLH